VTTDWTEAYGLYADDIYRLAWVILRNTDDAAEAMQATFERALRARASFDPNRPLRPWLMRIAANEAISLARRRRVRAWIPLANREPAAGPRVEDTVAERSVWQVVAKLSAAQRAAVALHYVYGYSVDEIAEIQEVPRGTIASRLHHARRRLRLILPPEEPQG